jgi:hypothetical protein
MNTECDLCHSSGNQNNPFIGMSDGTDMNPGIGCTGCHDAVGLRAHHTNAGIMSCVGCHPNDPPPDPENISPPYYDTFDTNAGDPCNSEPLFRENYSLDEPPKGLDNDGDLVYDGADTDCGGAPLCPEDTNGDNVVDVTDLINVILCWLTDGQDCPDPGTDSDVTDDGVVDVLDLIAVILAWGLCE